MKGYAMDSYLSEILKKVFLSQKLKTEISEQIKQVLNEKVEQGKTIEQAIEWLGTPLEVADNYNLSYKKAMQKSLSSFSILAVFLLVFMLFMGFLGTRSLYNYAQMQGQWYQYQLYQYATSAPNSSDTNQSALVGNQDFDTAAQSSANTAFVNPVKIDTLTLSLSGILIIVCILGLVEISKTKKEIRKGKFRFKPSVVPKEVYSQTHIKQ